jgi:predicted aspartyl protease
MYFTVETKLQVEKANIPVTQLQFYNSEEILLVRQMSKEDFGVEKGRIKIQNGRQVEEVIIPRNTPGICELFDEKTLKISFDKGNDNAIAFLVERKNGVVTEGSHFKIAAKEWVSTERGNKVGKMDYEGKVFTLVRGFNSRLLIDKSVLNKVNRDTKVVKGRKL